MQIVIDIPEEQYRTLNAKTQNDVVDVVDNRLLINAIKNGTPLPKGHGDLIDREVVLDMMNHGILEEYINIMGAVIPADKGE